jgi:5,10-methylenetetrahydromethanopterin reductase
MTGMSGDGDRAAAGAGRDEARVPVGLMLPVSADAPTVVELARRAEDGGVAELWIAEDLGLHGGVALVGAVLAATDQVPVGLGIAPAAARHPAFLAMQAATLGQLYPGRFRLGIGHGMPDWMRSLGVWPASPLTRLEETILVVRRLLAGEHVTFAGEEVRVDGTRLATAPVEVPIYAGVRGPRSLEAAGRVADGVVLAGWTGPAYIRHARALVEAAAGRERRVVASARFAVDDVRTPGSAQVAGAAQVAGSAHERLAADLARAGRSIADMVVHAPGEGRPEAAALLAEVGIAGTVTDLRDGIRRWRAAGADLVLLDPLSVSDLEVVLAAGAVAG